MAMANRIGRRMRVMVNMCLSLSWSVWRRRWRVVVKRKLDLLLLLECWSFLNRFVDTNLVVFLGRLEVS